MANVINGRSGTTEGALQRHPRASNAKLRDSRNRAAAFCAAAQGLPILAYCWLSPPQGFGARRVSGTNIICLAGRSAQFRCIWLTNRTAAAPEVTRVALYLGSHHDPTLDESSFLNGIDSNYLSRGPIRYQDASYVHPLEHAR